MARYTLKAIQALALENGFEVEKVKLGYTINNTFLSTLVEVKEWMNGAIEAREQELPQEIEEQTEVQEIQVEADTTHQPILADELVSALTKTSPVIATNPKHKVLGYVRVQADSGVLSVTSTDLSNFITIKLECDEALKIDTLVPHALVSNWLKACKGIYFNLETATNEDDDQLIKFSNYTMQYQFKGMSADNFPSIPKSDQSITTLTFGYEGLVGALVAAASIASDDQTKPVLTGIHVVVKDGLAKIEATDGHIINTYQVKVDGEDCEFILSRELVKILKGSTPNPIQFKVHADAVTVTCGELCVVSRLLEGEYPDTSKITGWSDASDINVSLKALKAAIKRCAGKYDKKNKSDHLIWLSGDVKNSTLVVDGKNGSERISAQIIGDNPDCAYLNSSLLQDILRSIKGQDQLMIKLGRKGLTSVQPLLSNQMFALMAALELSEKSPIAREDDATIVIRGCSYEQYGKYHTFAPAIPLPYQRTEEGLIVVADIDESWRDDNGYMQSFKEYQQAVELPYQYQDRCLTVTQNRKEEWTEWTPFKRGGTRKNSWLSVEYAIAEPLPEIEINEPVEETVTVEPEQQPQTPTIEPAKPTVNLPQIDIKDIAKEVKDRLVRNFPVTSFKVTSTHNSLDISWVDGSSQDKVTAIAHRFCGYEYYNDGLNDGYRLRPIKFKGKEAKTYLEYLHYNRRLSKQHYASVLKIASTQQIDIEGIEISDYGYTMGKMERREEVSKMAHALSSWEAITDTVTLEQIDGFIDRILKQGEVTADRMREVWQAFRSSEEPIKVELAKLTKKGLKEYSGSLYDDKKENLVKWAYVGIAEQFLPKSGYSCDMDESPLAGIGRVIAVCTDEQIQARAERIRQNTKAWVKTHTNPETLEEFETFIHHHGIEKLSEEELIKYDELLAKAGRESREQQKARNLTIQSTELPEGIELTIQETKHTRDGYDLWVVQLSDRVESEVFKELKNRADALNGWYSSYNKNGAVPGFQFKEESKAQEFISLSRIDGKERLEQREEARKEKAVSHLSLVADNLKESATAVLNADRKTNTVRRANIASYMEANARSSIQMAETTLNLADAIASGSLSHISRARFLTDSDELDTQLNQAKYNAIRIKDIRYGTDEYHAPATLADVQYAKFPFPYVRKSTLLSIADAVKQRSGLVLVAARIKKACANSKDADFVWFKSESEIEQLQDFLNRAKGLKGVSNWDIDSVKECMASYKRLIRMDICNDAELRVALREYLKIKADRRQADPIKEAERDLVGVKIDGFVSTPKATVAKMLQLADIRHGMTVLEPSAGSGHIADEVRKLDGVELTVIEQSWTLRQLLEKKGYVLSGNNSLEHTGSYDRILLNPAWENGHDIDEIRWCYNNCLKDGGRMVAIASKGSTTRGDKKADSFQWWLEEIGAAVEELPEDAFKESGYNVRGVLIVIDKPEVVKVEPEPVSVLEPAPEVVSPPEVVERKLDRSAVTTNLEQIQAYLEIRAKSGDEEAIAILAAITKPVKEAKVKAPKQPKPTTTPSPSKGKLQDATAKQEKWDILSKVQFAIDNGKSAREAAQLHGLPTTSISAELAGYRLAVKYPELFDLWQEDQTTWSNIRSAAQCFKGLGVERGLSVARGELSLKQAKQQSN